MGWADQYVDGAGGNTSPAEYGNSASPQSTSGWGDQYVQTAKPTQRPQQSVGDWFKGELGGVGDMIKSSPVGQFASDIAAPFEANMYSDVNNDAQAKDNALTSQIQQQLKTTTDPVHKANLLALLKQGPQQIDTMNQVPNINRSTEQVIGDAVGTAGMALSGGGLTGVGGSGLAGLAEANAAPTAAKGLQALLSGGSTNGLLGTALGRIGNAAAQGVVQGGSNSMAKGGDALGVAQSALVGGLESGGISGGIEGISALKNLLRPAIGKTPVGQVFGNPSSDVTRGLYNLKDKTGQGPTTYLGNLGKAEEQAGPIDVRGLQENAQNTLTNSPSNNGFNAQIHQVSPEDLDAMRQWIAHNDDRMGSVIANPNAPLGTAMDAHPIYQKYFSPTELDPYSKLANSVDNARYRFNAGNGMPADQDYRRAFQAAIDNNGAMGINFSGTGIMPNGAGAKQIVSNYQKLMSMNNPTLTELNGLKQDIGGALDEVVQPGTKAYALLTAMKGHITNELSKNPAYAQSSNDYQGYLAGKGFHQVLPSHLLGGLEAGGLGIGASLLHNPAILAGVPLASPIVQGTALRAAGAVNRAAGTVTAPISNAVRNSSGAVPQLLRSAGILP